MLNSLFYVNKEMATRYGFEEAAILGHIAYWIYCNKKAGRNFKDGKTWTYNTIKAYADTFDIWSEGQIRRIFKNLEKKGAIIRGNYSSDPYDRTTWYALGDDNLLNLMNFKNQQVEVEKPTNPDLSKSTNDIDSTNIKPIEETKSIISVFNYWNSKKHLIKHRKLIDGMKKNVEAKLKEHSFDELIKCIDNYEDILSAGSYCDYKHSLDEFFRPGKQKPAPYMKFLPERFVRSNFVSDDSTDEPTDDQPEEKRYPNMTTLINTVKQVFSDWRDYEYFPPENDESVWKSMYDVLREGKGNEISVKKCREICEAYIVEDYIGTDGLGLESQGW